MSSFLSHHPLCLLDAQLSSLRIPNLWDPYPLHSNSSSITAPSARYGIWRMCASMYLTPWRRRVLDSTVSSDIQPLTKPHISEYSCFSLLLSSKDKCRCAATTSVIEIPSVEYTIGVKDRLRSIQGWRHLSFFSLSAVAWGIYICLAQVGACI